MTFQEFDALCERIDAECNKICDTKGKEYAHDADRLANFKRWGQRLNLDPKMVLWVFLGKHLDSIESFIQSGQTFSTEPIEGRIKDAIVYLKLLWGLIEESKGKNCSGCGGTGTIGPSSSPSSTICPACKGTGKERSK